jgi:septal ring factor EnvC (AmiA/AmiB activator)
MAAMLAAALPAAAQDSVQALQARQNDSVAEFERLMREKELSSQRVEELAVEVDKVKKDYASLTAALIQAAKTERKLGEDVEAIEDRLTTLKQRQAGIRKSLAARQDVLTEVLGALERMGLNPPPAILVRPDDALASVRSAILLGAVVPELRADTEILIADLKELSRTEKSIADERDRLRARIEEQTAEQKRLSLLLDEKKKLQSRTQKEMADEREKAADLAAKADSVHDLIASLEDNIETLRKQEEKRLKEEARARAKAAEKPVPDQYRLAEPVPFGDRKGLVAVPVVGAFGRRFGEDDGAGGTLQGDIVRTQSGAIVTSPADATVLYAGPFRSYGELLILNAGDGYHIVLAGMDKISVSLGQSVLAGEPVGAMGEARLASIASGDGGAGPELYVEFRKDGEPLDPAPWWSKELSGRTGNDT